MKKVVNLIGVLDIRIIDKLIYLDKLVKLYSKFLNTWKLAEVTSDGKIVQIKFFKINKFNYESFTKREFSIDDLHNRIISYKRKWCQRLHS